MTRKMKDAGIEWIDQIPEDWKIVKVKDAFVRKNTKANTKNPTILTLARSGIKVRDISNNEGQLAADYTNYNPVEIDDLLLNPMDLISGDNCNISKVKGVISPAYVNLRYKKGTNPEFYNLYFKNLYWGNVFFAHGKGVSYENRWTLNYETLSQMKLPYPPSFEQNKIAEFLVGKLNKIEDIKYTILQEIHNLEDYKKSVITEAVTKGLDKNVEMKDSEIEWIGEIPKHWEVKRLKQLLSNDPDSLKVGPFGSTLKSSDLVNNGKWVYNQRTVIDNNFSTNDTFIDDKKFVELRGFKVQAGDILLTTRGTIGKIAIVPSEFYEGVIHPCIIKFNLNKKIFENELIRFIFNHTDLVLKQVEFLSNSTTIGVIYSYNLVNIYIPTPPIGEQSQIIDYLNKKTKSIDEAIESKQKQLKILEEFKKSHIYEYVTGKKEVE